MKITRWKLMVTKLKDTLILSDYELDLFKKLQNFEVEGCDCEGFY